MGAAEAGPDLACSRAGVCYPVLVGGVSVSSQIQIQLAPDLASPDLMIQKLNQSINQ